MAGSPNFFCAKPPMPQCPEALKPQGPKASRPKKTKAPRPKRAEASRRRSPEAPKSQGGEAPRPKRAEAPKPKRAKAQRPTKSQGAEGRLARNLSLAPHERALREIGTLGLPAPALDGRIDGWAGAGLFLAFLAYCVAWRAREGWRKLSLGALKPVARGPKKPASRAQRRERALRATGRAPGEGPDSAKSLSFGRILRALREALGIRLSF
jgi:hypothetical protein